MRISLALGLLMAGAAIAAPKASSELRDEDGTRHPVSLAFDGLLGTGWAEGDMGDGTGSWIELPLNGTVEVRSVSIWPGNMATGERSLREFGRPRVVKVTLSGGEEEVVVDATLLDPGERGPLRTDIPIEGTGNKLRFEVVEAREGGIRNELYISEIGVNFTQGDNPGAVEKLSTWLDGDRGKAALEKNREEVIELYDKVKAEEEGYTDAFKELMNRAGDGAPFLRKQVLSMVPDGYRAKALRPDDTAVEALLKIKDSNAIPALERAALRSVGNEARKLRGQVDIFKAYQDLVGGGRFNIPPFGTTGWEKGALESFGEPLPIEVDVFGGVWVGDLANNRVQQFSSDGIVEKQWGHEEPGITSEWFTQSTRTHYVAGSQAGTKKGEFVTPIDTARIPLKEFDWIAVLDAKGRITLIDDAGKVALVIEAPIEDGIVPGVGGEGHLEYTKKGGGRLLVVWGNEGWVFGMDGEERGHFELEDGSPTGAVALKNGKLGLIYGKQLVMYSLDGFRHGDLMGGVLGEGFEAWDICTDDKGKHWVVTDKAELHKLKKPGVIDFTVKLEDFALEVPRCAVYDGMAFITSKNEIRRYDAIELKAQQDLAGAEAAAQ